MGSRFDTYQRQVEDRFTKINAEFVLLRNKVDMLEQRDRMQLSSLNKPDPYAAKSTLASQLKQEPPKKSSDLQ
jgi:hypothetical protein